MTTKEANLGAVEAHHDSVQAHYGAMEAHHDSVQAHYGAMEAHHNAQGGSPWRRGGSP